MSKNPHRNTHIGSRPREFYCLYSHQYVIRGCYNRNCRCAHCHIGKDCKSCAINYDADEIKRRDSMCADCAIKTRQIRARIAAEKEQMGKTK